MALCPKCNFNYGTVPYQTTGHTAPGNTPIIIVECQNCHTTLSVAVDVAELMRPEVDRLIAALKDAKS